MLNHQKSIPACQTARPKSNHKLPVFVWLRGEPLIGPRTAVDRKMVVYEKVFRVNRPSPASSWLRPWRRTRQSAVSRNMDFWWNFFYSSYTFNKY
jgi:hypothetical protein